MSLKTFGPQICTSRKWAVNAPELSKRTFFQHPLQRWPWRLKTGKNLPEGSSATQPKEREFLPDSRAGFRDETSRRQGRAWCTVLCAGQVPPCWGLGPAVLSFPFLNGRFTVGLSLAHHCILGVCWALWAVRLIILLVPGYLDHTQVPRSQVSTHWSGWTSPGHPHL